MSMTLELVAQRVEILEKQMAALMADKTTEPTKSDKKSAGGAIRWVVLEGSGQSSTRRDVPDDVVRSAIESLVG